jgi:hypothetical protein
MKVRFAPQHVTFQVKEATNEALWPRAAPVSHQKRPEQTITNAIEIKRKHGRITEPIDILPLITVGLRVQAIQFPK